MGNKTNTLGRRVTRKGAGRTVGSFSFVKVPLSDLVAKFADQTTQIVVGRKFAEAIGLQVTSAPANEINAAIQAQAAPVEVKAISL